MSIGGPSEQRFGRDRDKPAAQEGSKRPCISRSDLREDRSACFDHCEAFGDQAPTMAGSGPTGIEQFDRQFEPVHQSPPDGDQPDVVGVHPNITAMCP